MENDIERTAFMKAWAEVAAAAPGFVASRGFVATEIAPWPLWQPSTHEYNPSAWEALDELPDALTRAVHDRGPVTTALPSPGSRTDMLAHLGRNYAEVITAPSPIQTPEQIAIRQRWEDQPSDMADWLRPR